MTKDKLAQAIDAIGSGNTVNDLGTVHDYLQIAMDYLDELKQNAANHDFAVITVLHDVPLLETLVAKSGAMVTRCAKQVDRLEDAVHALGESKTNAADKGKE